MTMPAMPPQQPPFLPPPRPLPAVTNGTAIASVVLGPIAVLNAAFVPLPYVGIVAIFTAFPLAVATVVLAHLGLGTARRYGVGRAMAVVGLICGYVALGVILATVILFFSQFLLIRPYMVG
ncbi:hypothetical protein AB6V29_01765 [Microbacterium sp. 20-116]|uniref:hypothetical protein n=1 Tax=unclassified Microbacterium TaxID=2609290 RepID=UPI00278F87B4|nr:hypothetical protein [Microbacterium sp. SORGH_AS_0421]MDQ1177942.1 putative membrane protein [Microbacterium sp. SORGH_AS_0421]